MAKPNILMVMADQLAPHFTGAYGHPLVRTPALDALAERGPGSMRPTAIFRCVRRRGSR